MKYENDPTSKVALEIWKFLRKVLRKPIKEFIKRNS